MQISVPGKIILSGEHSVVYGYPAIATAVNKRLTVNSVYKVTSEIPIGSGMGSSAAFCVAHAALEILVQKQFLDTEQVAKRALELEKQYHEYPSGIDTTVCTYGGYLLFQNGKYEHLKPKISIPELLFINTGRPQETTKEMVLSVQEQYVNQPKRTKIILNNIGAISNNFVNALQGKETVRWRELIRENERYLEELSVVSNSTQKLIRSIEKLGGAAKVCGAGGRKEHSGMLLTYHENPEDLKLLLTKYNIESIDLKLGEGGVKVETR